MKKTLPRILFFLGSCFLFLVSAAQATNEYCVRITATIQEIPPRITLNWTFDTAGVTQYSISRKTKTETIWHVITALPVTASSYTDTTVVADSSYEYRVTKSGAILADGYIYAGIKAPPLEYKGKLLLVVDSLLNDSLSAELHRLMKDISGDGWAIKLMEVDTADPDYWLKILINGEYQADTANVKAVMLVGDLAVPYSGDINPDGHPNHLGAWPADVYYANLHYTFDDVSVNDTVASRPENRNVPGDGKWDPSWTFGSTNELQVSRLYFKKMTAFGRTENQLMKSYLDKDHNYRMKNILTTPRALIDDNFGAFSGEAFAISGWRNFAPILGDSNIVQADYITTLDTADYQWSYGCGGGSFTSASGIGNTSDFVTRNVRSIFTMLFGSYFGDWDSDNDFLRAPLCAPEPALTVCWAGRPHWVFHHMALGENIGYDARLTQNQVGSLYQMNYAASYVHVALLGDLTLREHIISPPLITSLKDTNETATIRWMPSADSVLGYYVYRSTTEFGKYDRISANILTSDSFIDNSVGPGLKFYMVRAIKLENTPSGTYYNLSEGISDSITVRDTVMIGTHTVALNKNGMNLQLLPNPASEVLMIDVTMINPTNFTIEIFDAQGANVQMRTLRVGDWHTSVDVSDFAPGVYICRLTTMNNIVEKIFAVAR